MHLRRKTLNNSITIQKATDYEYPDEEDIIHWAKHTLKQYQQNNVALTIRIVNNSEMQRLNNQFRHKNKSTNVIAFPFEPSSKNDNTYLGDIAICPQVVTQEAKQQDKPYHAHFAHMVIHAILHLLGYDHIKENEAERMENAEIKLLAQLGIANPYVMEK